MKGKVKLSIKENSMILNIPEDLIHIPKKFLSKEQIKIHKMINELRKRIKKLEENRK